MTYALTTDRVGFLEALKTLRKLVPKKQASEAVLSCTSDGTLGIDLPGGSVDLDVDGSWPGTVRVPGDVLLKLARFLPDGDPLHLFVRDGRFFIQGYSLPCRVDTGEPRPIIELPLDPPLDVILHVAQTHSDEDLTRSGLTPLVRGAEERRDKLIQQALAVLRPLRIRASDLESFIDDVVRRNNSK